MIPMLCVIFDEIQVKLLTVEELKSHIFEEFSAWEDDLMRQVHFSIYGSATIFCSVANASGERCNGSIYICLYAYAHVQIHSYSSITDRKRNWRLA